MNTHARKGRPRLARERFASGQVKAPSVEVAALQWHRLRRISKDPRLSSEVGRLAFMGRLDAVEAATAERISRIFAEFDRALGKNRFAKSAAYEIGRATTPGEETEDQADRARAAIRKMTSLENEIQELAKQSFRGLRGAIIELCIEDSPLPSGVFPAVKEALASLAGPLGVRAAMAGQTRDSSRAARDRN